MEKENHPTQDEVLDYFESVNLCLDQRTTSGNVLFREMDRLSKGAHHVAPPTSVAVTNSITNSMSQSVGGGGGYGYGNILGTTIPSVHTVRP